MRIITKSEYLDPQWEIKRLYPEICLRLYVQTETGDVGPFDTEAEAATWMKENYND